MTIYNTPKHSDASLWFLRGLDVDFMQSEDHIDYKDPVSSWSWLDARLCIGEVPDPSVPVPRSVVYLHQKHYFLSIDSTQNHRIFEAPATDPIDEPRLLDFQEMGECDFLDLATDGEHLFALDRKSHGIWRFIFDHGGTSFPSLHPSLVRLPDDVNLTGSSRLAAWSQDGMQGALIWNPDQKGARLFVGGPDRIMKPLALPWEAEGEKLPAASLRVGDALVAKDSLHLCLQDRRLVLSCSLEDLAEEPRKGLLEFQALANYKSQPALLEPISLAFHSMEQLSIGMETDMAAKLGLGLAERVRKQRHLVCLDLRSTRAVTLNVTPAHCYTPTPKDSKESLLPLLGHPASDPLRPEPRNLLTRPLRARKTVPIADGGLLFGELGRSEWVLLRPCSVQLDTWRQPTAS